MKQSARRKEIYKGRMEQAIERAEKRRAQAERERMLTLIGEVRGWLENNHNEKYKDTHPGYIIAAYDFEHLLKQRLEPQATAKPSEGK